MPGLMIRSRGPCARSGAARIGFMFCFRRGLFRVAIFMRLGIRLCASVLRWFTVKSFVMIKFDPFIRRCVRFLVSFLRFLRLFTVRPLRALLCITRKIA